MSDEAKSREQLLAELREARAQVARYRTYVDAGPQAIFVVDGEGRYIDVNPAACEQTGYSRAELLSRSIADISTSDEPFARLTRLERRGVIRSLTELRRRDGSTFLASLNAVRLDGDPVSYIGYVSDVTEIAEHEAALTRERDRAQNYLDTVHAIIVALDTEGNITLLNREGCRVLGYTEDELLGKSWFATCLPQPEGLEEVLPYFIKLIAGEAEALDKFENPVVTRAGTVREIAWRNTMLYGPAGEIVGTLSAGEDITDRKRLEQQLQQTQKLEALGTLAGGVAHDMNNVLALVMGLASVTAPLLPADHPAQVNLRGIVDASHRGKNLVERLLGFARKKQYDKRSLDLNDVVDELISVLGPSVPKKVRIEAHRDAGIGRIRGDHSQILQTLLNVCINANDALAGAGTITITTRDVESAAARAGELSTLFPGRYVLVEIRDDGPGMTEEVRKRALEPFFTTKDVGRGTGLGLSMAYGVVTNHHGALIIESAPGAGTRVELWFPVLEAAVAAEVVEAGAAPSSESPASEQDQAQDLAKPTILVVDDEAMLRTVFCRMLEGFGYRTLAAASGRAAIDLYRERGPTIDLVLLDLSMPDMDGYECFAGLQALDPEVRVLLCTGHGEEPKTTELLRLGVLGIANKPFSGRTLEALIDEALTRERTRPST